MGLSDPRMNEIYQKLVDSDPNWKNALHDIFQSINDALDIQDEEENDNDD